MPRIRRTALAVVLAVGAAALEPGSAAAEVGTGPAVRIGLPLNTPLGTSLEWTADTELPGDVVDASITVSLKVGDRSVGQLGSAALRVTNVRVLVPFAVPPALRAQARAIGRATGRARGTVVFVTRSPGQLPQATERFVSLEPPVRTTGPTPIGLGRRLITGDGSRVARGTVTLATPVGWLRTSAPGADTATFGPVPVAGACTATVLASPGVIVSRSITATAAADGLPDAGDGSTARAGRRGDLVWRVATLSTGPGAPFTTAFAARRIAPRRYAVVRVRVTFGLGCPAGAARTPALIAQLERAVRGVTASVRLVRP